MPVTREDIYAKMMADNGCVRSEYMEQIELALATPAKLQVSMDELIYNIVDSSELAFEKLPVESVIEIGPLENTVLTKVDKIVSTD